MIRNPLYYDDIAGVTIDLSQLVEVGDPWISGYHPNGYSDRPEVGFSYCYAANPKEVRSYRRHFRQGPWRNPDLTFRNPAEQLLAVGEEMMVIYDEAEKSGSRFNYVVVVDEETQEPVAFRNMKRHHAKLIEAWRKWKEIEPEIYAIIRKHL